MVGIPRRGRGDSAIAADPERDCDESQFEERVTPTETKGGGSANPCVPNQCERVLPLVNRLEPEPKPTPVAGGIGPDIVGETPKTEPERETIQPFGLCLIKETLDGVTLR